MSAVEQLFCLGKGQKDVFSGSNKVDCVKYNMIFNCPGEIMVDPLHYVGSLKFCIFPEFVFLFIFIFWGIRGDWDIMCAFFEMS